MNLGDGWDPLDPPGNFFPRTILCNKRTKLPVFGTKKFWDWAPWDDPPIFFDPGESATKHPHDSDHAECAQAVGCMAAGWRELTAKNLK